MRLASEQLDQYRDDGYVVVRGLFDSETVHAMTEHFMRLRAEGPKPGDMGGRSGDAKDPLNRFPRMINMHAWDAQSETWSKAGALLQVVGELIGDVPVLRQTMLYFKPPGARGQALHQDQQYITMDPLIGAWVALDRADAANGQMVLVPGSHRWGLLPVQQADESRSFVGGGTVLPEGAREIGIDMEAGDCLLFDGKTVHGSHPNVTAERFRRSFICHFIGERSRKFDPDQGKHMSHLRKAAAAQTP